MRHQKQQEKTQKLRNSGVFVSIRSPGGVAVALFYSPNGRRTGFKFVTPVLQRY